MIDQTILERIDFDKLQGLIPVIVQEEKSKDVLMMAYMNKESLRITMEKKVACYYSRSRQELWLKGETSGHYQHVRKMMLDCDGDTLLLFVDQIGVACHTGAHSCFYQTIFEEES